MEASDQFNAPSTLPRGKLHPVPAKQKAGWTISREVRFLHLDGIEKQSLDCPDLSLRYMRLGYPGSTHCYSKAAFPRPVYLTSRPRTARCTRYQMSSCHTVPTAMLLLDVRTAVQCRVARGETAVYICRPTRCTNSCS